MSKKDPEIRFLPVCTECRAILDDMLIGITGSILYEEEFEAKATESHIIPVACPHCGAVFQTINMPVRLPVYPSRVAMKQGED